MRSPKKQLNKGGEKYTRWNKKLQPAVVEVSNWDEKFRLMILKKKIGDKYEHKYRWYKYSYT